MKFKRFSKETIVNIIDEYLDNTHIDDLAEKYQCSSVTIRTTIRDNKDYYGLKEFDEKLKKRKERSYIKSQAKKIKHSIYGVTSLFGLKLRFEKIQNLAKKYSLKQDDEVYESMINTILLASERIRKKINQ